MTDLPTLKIPVPPIPQEDEEWCLRMVSQEDPNDNRRATLEDVRAVLAVAGYVVVEQRVLKPGEKIEYDAPPPRVPKTTQEKVDWLKCLGFSNQQIYEIIDPRQECSACDPKTSGIDPRPTCIVCRERWVPAEGVDATVTSCPACWQAGKVVIGRPAEGREEPGTCERCAGQGWRRAKFASARDALPGRITCESCGGTGTHCRYSPARLGIRTPERRTCTAADRLVPDRPVDPCADQLDRPDQKTSGTPGGGMNADEGGITSRPAECREEPGTIVPEFGRQKVLEVCLGGTPRRATFADLHEVEREHWISLLPCTECEFGPVNDKICVTCFEVVSAKLEESKGRMRDLALAVREGLAKRDWGTIKKGMLSFDGIMIGGITIEEEGAAKLHGHVRDLAAKVVALDQIAKDAIKGLHMLNQTPVAYELARRLEALK